MWVTTLCLLKIPLQFQVNTGLYFASCPKLLCSADVHQRLCSTLELAAFWFEVKWLLCIKGLISPSLGWLSSDVIPLFSVEFLLLYMDVRERRIRSIDAKSLGVLSAELLYRGARSYTDAFMTS